jgi:hypothetical protein
VPRQGSKRIRCTNPAFTLEMLRAGLDRAESERDHGPPTRSFERLRNHLGRRGGFDLERIRPSILARMRLLAETTETVNDCERAVRIANVLDRLVLDHLADKLFTPSRCRALARDLIERAGLLRQRVDDRRVQLRAQIGQAEKAIAKWEAAFESGTDLDVVAPRLRELRAQHAALGESLDGLQPLGPAPKNLLTAETVKRFRDKISDIFISNDTPMTKNYLRFLVEKIEVLDDRIVIEAKARNAVALMAHPEPLEGGDVNHPEPVLAKGREWLRLLDSNQRPGG